MPVATSSTLDELVIELIAASSALTNCYKQLSEMIKIPVEARKNPPKTEAEFDVFMRKLVDCANEILEQIGVFDASLPSKLGKYMGQTKSEEAAFYEKIVNMKRFEIVTILNEQDKIIGNAEVEFDPKGK